MQRIREGSVTWANPYNGKPVTTSLRPEDVSAIVFWSKDFSPLVPHLDELDSMGYRYLFYFTITGAPRAFEASVPEPSRTLPVARLLAERYGPEAVLWRYDPVVISSITGFGYHIDRFGELASSLAGSTKRCYFSFMQYYAKVKRNLARFEHETGIVCRDPSLEEKLELANKLADIAAQYDITLYSCCSDNLVQGPIKKAKCVDAELLVRLYPEKMRPVPPPKTRKECGCYESRDIGTYDTCTHGCVYCYANASSLAWTP